MILSSDMCMKIERSISCLSHRKIEVVLTLHSRCGFKGSRDSVLILLCKDVTLL